MIEKLIIFIKEGDFEGDWLKWWGDVYNLEDEVKCVEVISMMWFNIIYLEE